MPIPREPPVTKTEAPLNVGHRFGSGSYAGAELGISSQPIRVRGSLPPCSAFDDACPRRLEQPHLLLAVAAHRVIGGKVLDQLADAGADLEREVRRRRPDEGVDVADRGLGHAREA